MMNHFVDRIRTLNFAKRYLGYPVLTATLLLGCVLSTSCAPPVSDSFSTQSSSGNRLLYVASGGCYAGGVTTSTGVSTLVAYDMNGLFHHLVVDYNQYSPGDTPVSFVEYDSLNLLVLVENTSGRHIDLVRKDGSSITTFLLNSTALSGVVRDLARATDGSLYVSKSTAIEKFSSARVRILQGANPYVNAPAGSCATSTTLITSIVTLPSGKIVYAHSAATTNNRLGVVNSLGYSVAADCLSGQVAPTTLAMPTALLYHSSGKLIGTFGSTTNSSNFIYSYDISDATGIISAPIASFTDASLINGPSAMAENTATGEIFVANGNSTFNTIEKFSFNPLSKILTRAGNAPFVVPQVYTKCVADMKVLVQ